MKQYENVDLINSKAIADSKPDCMEGSLYEAVKTQEAYVDVCLKRYLGHIIKCRSVEELEHRLRGRGTETEESIRERLATAQSELAEQDKFTLKLVNDEVDACAARLYDVICQRAGLTR